jgi:hypothetical protein
MDGNAPINIYEPQFTQKEACEVARVDSGTVNNWIERRHVRLAEIPDRRLAGRRLFSIVDITFLAVMGVCTRDLGMAPTSAVEWASSVVNEFSFILSNKDNPNRRRLDTIHIGQRLPDGAWSVGFAYYDRENGKFLQPGAEKTLDVHLRPALIIPSTRICTQVFLECSNLLMNEDAKAGPSTSGLDPAL